jgi:hypothetical protein
MSRHTYTDRLVYTNRREGISEFEWEEAVCAEEEESNTRLNDSVYEEPHRFHSALNVMSKRWDEWYT